MMPPPTTSRRLGISAKSSASVESMMRGSSHGNEGSFTGWLPAAMMQCRSEEHTSELQSLMRISYAVFCLKKKKHKQHKTTLTTENSLTKIVTKPKAQQG